MAHATNPLPKFDPGKIKVPGPIPSLQPPLAKTQNTLSTEVEVQARSCPLTDTIQPPAKRNPLSKFSLLGKADEMEANAVKAKPLLGNFIMSGQATMIYAGPNTGKTLVMLALGFEAMSAGDIDPGNFFYIDADDSSEGLAVKSRLMQDAGGHLLAPGHGGFRTSHLVEMMEQAIADNSARGTCVVIDTMKKFTDLMDKKRTSETAQICRQYVSVGGSVIGLGHTTKNPNADGTPRYQGGTDILDDFDCVYMAEAMISKTGASQKVVKFTRIKSRANCPEVAAYAYATDSSISYEEKLASVQAIDPDELDRWTSEPEDYREPLVLQAFRRRIGAGCNLGKMALSKEIAKECRISHRTATAILDRYTGTIPLEHLWTYENGPRGVRIYRLVDQTTPDP